jgi:intein/homing endonuclease
MRCLMGPFGSGKSSGCVIEDFRRAHEQRPSPDGIRRTRSAVIRNCFDDRTEVLTETRGWQLFKDLLEDDKVATLDGDNLVYKLPDGILSYPYQGEMIGFEGEGANFLVTPEHKMWISKRRTRKKIWGGYEVFTAEEIYKNQTVRVRRDAVWEGVDPGSDLNYFEFLGFWFAEGHAGRYNSLGDERLNITQKDNLLYIESLLDRNNLEYRKYEKPGTGCYTYHLEKNKALMESWDMFYTAGKATVKAIPLWIKNSPPRHLKAFLYGYYMGDGDKTGASIRLFTSSKIMADDLQEIILKAGMVANIRATDLTGKKIVINGRSGTVNAPNYTITILGEKKYRPILYVNPRQTNHLRGWYKEPYDGMVYCVNMPLIPIYVRRKGKAFWCLRSYLQLKDTTIKTFHDWFPPRLFGEWRVTDHTYIFKLPGIQHEVIFRALDRPDQVSNLLSLEITWAWFNEVREIPWSIIEAMDSRIGRYPSKRDGGASWYGMFMDTNPPDEGSELYNIAEKTRPDNFKMFKQPSGLSVHAENTKYLPAGYYTNLAKGKSEMYKRIYIHGQYGFLLSGKPVWSGFRDNIHIAPHPLEPIRGLDVITGWDFGLCYDDQTEVLTEHGWKYFQDVKDDDFIATKDFETNIIQYQQPTKRIARDYTGEMILYENQNLNFCVTPEHIVPCRKKYGRNGDTFKGNYRLTADYLYSETTTNYAVDLKADWEGDSSGVFGPLSWASSVFAEFMGLYLSEGSYDKKYSRISIYQDSYDKHFQKILDNTGLPWVRSKGSWRVTNKSLNEYLSQFGHASGKFVPVEIKRMNAHDIALFIIAYTRGDGHIRVRDNGAEEHTIFTTSKIMADDFQELALKVGWYAKIRVVKSQDSVIFEDGKGRVIHNEGGYSITFKKRAKQSRMLKKYFSKIQYSGKVYCLTVPNGTLYIRRKWTPSWNGNSPAVAIGQITPLGQLRIIDEVVSDDTLFKPFIQNQVYPLLNRRYFGMNIMGFGDMTGTNRTPTSESTSFDILHAKDVGLTRIIPAPTNDMVARLGAVDNFLCKMINGDPGIIISPTCKHLRKAMNGGYHYEKDRKGEMKPKPEKNFSSHISDALQYLCMFISERDEQKKRWASFRSQIKKMDHRPASLEVGY